MAGTRSSRPSTEGRRIGKRRTDSARRATGSDSPAGGGGMGGRIREHDWSATPLGPVETWPQSLWSAVSILLPSRAQVVLFWGPAFIATTHALRAGFGAKHPWALGRPRASVERGVAGSPTLRGLGQDGEASWRKITPSFSTAGIPRRDVLRRLVRSGPHRGGSVGGVFCIVSESRPKRAAGDRSSRRTAPSTLRELARKRRREEAVEAAGGRGRAGAGSRRCPFSLCTCSMARGSARSSSRQRGRARRPAWSES